MSERDTMPRWILAALIGLFSAWLLYRLRGVLAPVFFAFLIAYMLDPVIDRIEERGHLLRGAAITMLLVVVVAVGVVLLVVVAPMVVHDLTSFVRSLPETVARLRAEWEPVLERNGLTIPTSVG